MVTPAGAQVGAEPIPHHVPRELDMTAQAPYTIGMSDILSIDAVKVVPKAPARIGKLDVLSVFVEGPPADQPIAGTYAVDAYGYINLGPIYGRVMVAGDTLDEATDAIDRQLRRLLSHPRVSVTLSQSAGLQAIQGEHVVAPDGTVNLGIYGDIFVAGMTKAQAKIAIQQGLSKFLDDPEIGVDVFAYNSKNYFVIIQGAGFGDQILRFPSTGNETVLDALTQINGMPRFSSKKLWIARPKPDGSCYQKLPVEYEAVVSGGSTATNYQLFPGDRLFIKEDSWIAVNSAVDKLIGPFERIIGFTLLGSQTVQTINAFPIGNQGQGN